jgi:hypothetical protein
MCRGIPLAWSSATVSIDRKLQPAPEVFCRYFFYTDRPEDKVLRVLARKTRTIKDELGSFTDVISGRLKSGILRAEADRLAQEFDDLSDADKDTICDEELEADRPRGEALRREIQKLEPHRRGVCPPPPLRGSHASRRHFPLAGDARRRTSPRRTHPAVS